MTAIFALSGAMLIGASDYVGGLASRRAAPARISLWVQFTSMVGFAVLAVVVAAPVVTGRDIAAGVIAGASGGVSLVMFYTALSRGQLSVVAPITAAVGAVFPAAVGIARGESLRRVTLLGGVLVLVAVYMVTRDTDDAVATPMASIVLGVAAGIGFGVFFLALAEPDPMSGMWPLLAARGTSVALVTALALRLTGGWRVPLGESRHILFAGLTELLATIFTLLAFQRGPIVIASVLSGLYPVATVTLAWIYLGERLSSIQRSGVLVALIAVPLVALP